MRYSAKELEHYQTVRRAFESSGSEKDHRQATSGLTPSQAIQQAQVFMNGTTRPPSRPPFRARPRGKGKGQTSEWGSPPMSRRDSDEGLDESDDDAYVTSNDYGTPVSRMSRSGEGKGKGKARGGTRGADANGHYGFQDQADGDDELYA